MGARTITQASAPAMATPLVVCRARGNPFSGSNKGSVIRQIACPLGPVKIAANGAVWAATSTLAMLRRAPLEEFIEEISKNITVENGQIRFQNGRSAVTMRYHAQTYTQPSL